MSHRPKPRNAFPVAGTSFGTVPMPNGTSLMTAIRDAGRVYSFAGLETSGRIDLGGCAAGA
ncbi:hypothetical protein SAMN06296065_13016, partial [Novosphingobium panipatense]